ncbi:LysR family transcriptional regulator [Alphaproteobacteria bacterium LSUCC0684]
MLKLWHLKVIREVIKTGSISKAASALSRSQPALSLVIADVESRIGYKLFERVNGRLHPVPEAYFFLERSEEILEQINSLERSMQQGGGRIFEIRIACMPVLSEFFMPRQIARFAEIHPGVRFYMRAQPSERVLESLASQHFDLGFAERPQPSELYEVVNFTSETVVGLSADDPLALESALTPKLLDGRAFAGFLPEHHLMQALRDTFDNENCELNIPFALQNGAAQYALVESRQALGFMSLLNVWLYHQLRSKQATDAPPAIVFRRFRPMIKQTISLVRPRHRTLSQISQLFASEVETAIRDVLMEGERLIDT